MKKNIITLFSFLTTLMLFSQNLKYQPEKEKLFSLVHTKLKVDFNFDNSTMNGEEWVTLKPYFYPQKTLVLDAKAMLIHKVMFQNNELSYQYKENQIFIDLPRTYTKEEELTLYIKYTAQPEKVRQRGSAAITSAKGLYFINPKGLDDDKPTQIWTQGATESSSCWFPTLDSPNQKTSQEIYITVPNQYVTLSNGLLEESNQNTDGTRTDYWNFQKKHAPYLFFMGIGEYAIIKDSYKNIPVDYYVEEKYKSVAKQIFGDTPEILAFFSKITGVEYPWSKYAQIVGRDFVSGAMENTTAVIHGEHAYQEAGELVDENSYESTVAHEAFHHWFGDLVTAESWSNITVNESFANYSEYLWFEHKYGKYNADSHLYKVIKRYKNGDNYDKHLVRFEFEDKEDVFDAVSYNKGGAILHMLRNYIGDEAFFKSMNVYLSDNKYGTSEAHQWRLAVEKVTGRDMNWFFNQWYYSNGHPMLTVSYDYNKIQKTVSVNIMQSQEKVFKFPLSIDVFEKGKAIKHTVFVDKRSQTFTLPYNAKTPDFVLVNSDAILLCDIEENKTLQDYIYQLNHADTYKHQYEAFLEVAKNQQDKKAFKAIVKALDHPFYKIRKLALEKISLTDKNSKKSIVRKIQDIASNDKKTLVQAAAIETLGKLTDRKFKPVFEKAFQSNSYSVVGKALVAMYYIDSKLALTKSKNMPLELKKKVATPLTRIYLQENDDSDLEFIAQNVMSGMYLNQDKSVQKLYKAAFDKIVVSDNTKAIKNLCNDIVVKGMKYKQYGFDTVGINLLRQMVQSQTKANQHSKDKNILIIKESIARLAK